MLHVSSYSISQFLSLSTLNRLVQLYPTLHKPMQQSFASLSLKNLNGSVPPVDKSIVETSSLLYCSLPLTGGKVGATGLWRKSVDETLSLSWDCLRILRPSRPRSANHDHQQPLTSLEACSVLPLNLDRLSCCVLVLGDLLRWSSFRSLVTVTSFCT